jgi:hypothetical protein
VTAPADLVAGWRTQARRLWQEGRLIIAPVRHHSPACARAVTRLIRERRPAQVLIEGPADATPLIPLLLNPATRPPVAVYTIAEDSGGPRRAAYYPLCDYSPELAALREGARVGARLAFIDLDSAAYARLMPPAGGEDDEHRSRMAEAHFRISRTLAALCARLGARDHHEAWDRLFEARPDAEPRSFLADVAAYGLLARGDLTGEDLAAQATLIREQVMARAIRDALGTGEVVVVCGALHAQALLELAEGDAPLAPPQPAGGGAVYLIAYGFERLEALNGYAAGMRAPAWHQRLWDDPDGGRVAATLLTGLATELRDAGIAPLSLPDVTAALTQAHGLAALRGHGAPLREDVMDAIRSAFCKGETSAEGAAILAAARRLFTGDAIGAVPAGAGQPPLLADVRRRAAALRLDLTVSTGRELTLDIHRKPRHRARSRFLHALAFLGVPGAVMTRGPDLVAGRDLDLLMEHWTFGWTPQFDAVLIERAVLGTALEPVCLARLDQQLTELGCDGQGETARRAVALLAAAGRMGLADRLPHLLAAVEGRISADQDLASLTRALHDLSLLLRVRVPLGMIGTPEVTALAGHAWRRLCFLLPGHAGARDEAAWAVLACLGDLQEFQFGGGAGETMPVDLLLDAVEALAEAPSVAPLLAGAAAGLLHRGGRLGEEKLARRIAGLLQGAGGADQTDILCGLAATARQVLWSCPAVLSAANALVAQWDEETFLERLPDLRLAYAGLSPLERGGLARLLAAENGVALDLPSAGGGLAGLDGELAAALAADGLDGWEAP